MIRGYSGPPEGIAAWNDNRARLQVFHDQNPGILVPDSENHGQTKGQNERPGRVKVVIDSHEKGAIQPVKQEEKLVHAATVMPKVNLRADRLAVLVNLIRGLAAIFECLRLARGCKRNRQQFVSVFLLDKILELFVS